MMNGAEIYVLNLSWFLEYILVLYQSYYLLVIVMIESLSIYPFWLSDFSSLPIIDSCSPFSSSSSSSPSTIFYFDIWRYETLKSSNSLIMSHPCQKNPRIILHQVCHSNRGLVQMITYRPQGPQNSSTQISKRQES